MSDNFYNVLGVDENAVRELRGLDEDFSYNENDEVDMYEKPVRRTENQKKKDML